MNVEDVFGDKIAISNPSRAANLSTNAVVMIELEDTYSDHSISQWLGNRAGLRRLIEVLQEFEAALPPIETNDDASELPPQSNRVEGGVHFGIG